MDSLAFWYSILVCPVDRSPLVHADQFIWECPTCSFCSEILTIAARQVPDLRARDNVQVVSHTFTIPTQPLDRQAAVTSFFKVNSVQFTSMPDRFGSRLGREHQYYCTQVLEACGPDVPILDLGCGNAGNTRYLKALGFKNVLPVDWHSTGADILVDAHRLPFANQSFQMVISTAVFEHLYNPFIAISEISRILKPGGTFIGGASFWEAWHGSSYFHLTPDGWHALCSHAGLELEDLWAGWGIIPPSLAHVLTPGYLRKTGYRLQRMVEAVYRLFLGEQGVRKLQLRASGSYQVFARKMN